MNKKLRILFLCSWYPSRVLPNNGDFIERHAKAVSLLHKVTVLHIISDENCTKEIEIISEHKNGIESHIGYIKKTKNPIRKILHFYKTYKKLLSKIDGFDLIHLNTLYPFGLFAIHQKITKKLPYIISEHWTGYHKPQAEKLSYLRKKISKIITRRASYICTVSEDLKKSMELLNFKGNYNPVPNVVNTNLFYPQEQKNAVFTMLHVSNMVNDHKNIEGMLRVIAKFQQKKSSFIFKLIGENAIKYKPLADRLNIPKITIIYQDHIPHREVANELNKADVFILFSNYENLPCVILESFATGTPVIATDVGGINEYFPNDFGYLIDKGNEDELLTRIEDFYTSFKVDKEKMHQYVKSNFSDEIIAKKFSELYESSLKNNS